MDVVVGNDLDNGFYPWKEGIWAHPSLSTKILVNALSTSS